MSPENRQLPGNGSWTLSMLFEFVKLPKMVLRRLDSGTNGQARRRMLVGLQTAAAAAVVQTMGISGH
jgi:hypothetical protein